MWGWVATEHIIRIGRWTSFCQWIDQWTIGLLYHLPASCSSFVVRRPAQHVADPSWGHHFWPISAGNQSPACGMISSDFCDERLEKTGPKTTKNNEKPSTSLPAIELCLALDPTSPANHLASDWGDPDTGSGVYHRIDLIRKALNWSLNPGCAIIVDLVFSCLLLPSNLGSAKPQNYVSKAWIFAASSFCGGPLESSHVHACSRFVWRICEHLQKQSLAWCLRCKHMKEGRVLPFALLWYSRTKLSKYRTRYLIEANCGDPVPNMLDRFA